MTNVERTQRLEGSRFGPFDIDQRRLLYVRDSPEHDAAGGSRELRCGMTNDR
jgi:hypothetical protein